MKNEGRCLGRRQKLEFSIQEAWMDEELGAACSSGEWVHAYNA
jgi:hypothetical protein